MNYELAKARNRVQSLDSKYISVFNTMFSHSHLHGHG